MDFYKGDQRYDANKPHYVTTTASDWREIYPTRADALRFIETYGVTQEYKEQHYRVISVEEFWDRRNGHKPFRLNQMQQAQNTSCILPIKQV